MSPFPTPISILEAYFDRPLTPKTLRYWEQVDDETWIDFAKTYRAQMKADFTAERMAADALGGGVRLYFDPRLSHEYDLQLQKSQNATPLLGVSQYPSKNFEFNDAGLAAALGPLRKHLVLADQVYIEDHFYKCFDSVADMVDRRSWRSNPNIESLVRISIDGIARWLPILAGLRDLINTGALRFIPYYVTPSFPYSGETPLFRDYLDRMHVPREPGVIPAGQVQIDPKAFLYALTHPPQIDPTAIKRRPDYQSAANAWLNAKLLGLDPVFADRETLTWASGIKFRGDLDLEMSTDLMSIDLLPLERKTVLTVSDIIAMRRNELVFHEIRTTLVGCKDYLQKNVSPEADQKFLGQTCRDYILDNLRSKETYRSVRFLDNSIVGSTAFALAMGLSFMSADPWIGLVGTAFLTPKAFLEAEARLNPKGRAAARLLALL